MKKRGLKESMLAVIIFVIAASIIYIGILNTLECAREEQMHFLQKALKRSAIQCYAIEGMYPPDVKYLEDHYGLVIDHKRYIVHYEVFASNIMPDMTVFEKAGGE
ncbi:hypothetical protein [Cellulosilyticum sp. I15G10I2]|uniref:hypothetical protein n=1 Tax=Cellulosilyticum sp. I15G10I2 TaxID=1892843 RepID=UPI00085C0E99|nr:hypothetical protein [Cellulosilyticum sp. I15G10I2]